VGTLIAERVEELRRDTMHGAGWMAERAVDTLVEEASAGAEDADALLQRLHDAGILLAASRPAAGAVAGAVGRVLATAFGQRHLSADELSQLVAEEARAICDSRHRAARSIAIQLAPRLAGASVVTHSASATVREALVHTPPAHVTCTVSRPREEGRDFAEILREAGLQVDLVEDADAGGALQRANLLLVGADTVFRDGALCNKVGTSDLARSAGRHGVPTIVAAEVLKLAPYAMRGPDELSEEGTRDVTPPELIAEIVTEEGVFTPEEVAALIDRTPFLREGYELLRGGNGKPPAR
jgi:translation initiation factor 2B subunit (eIF-2B alpha/beta/delta family)